MPDIEPFKSPVDGSIVTGRKALREHNKRNNVTHTSDFTNQWEKQKQERERLYSGDTSYDSQRRKEHLIRAFEKQRR